NPTSTNPVTVEVEADSLMYQAREDRGAADTTEASQAGFIAERLRSQPTPINTNLEDIGEVDTEVDQGGVHEGSLLDFIQRWSQDNFVHWVDRMNGEVVFFYPGIKAVV